MRVADDFPLAVPYLMRVLPYCFHPADRYDVGSTFSQ